MLKIAIGCDHGGLESKNYLVDALKKDGYEIIDVGTYTNESCHYPDFGIKVAELVRDKKANFGVVICTSGEGIMIAANKVKGIRCGLAYNDDVARLMRQHNDANIISFGAKFMTNDEILRRTKIFLKTEFEGGRHQNRVDIISNYERK